MVQTCGISPEELRVCEGEYPVSEAPLETAWTFWYDKKSSDRKESDQYMEGLRQLGSFNTIEGFYRHYTYLLRPSDFPRDHNVLLFRKGYKPMWEEFPEGGCWIIRIKRKVSQSYVNRMWENLLIACIGEAFEMPDVVGCVLSTRIKDDVLSVWNLSNTGDTQARFRIGEKLKEVLDLDMNALIQYKDHMQSLQDYSTYRNAKNYMFAPSPSVTPLQGTLETPLHGHTDAPVDFDLMEGMLPPAAIDEMLPPAAIDTEAFGGGGGGHDEDFPKYGSIASCRENAWVPSASAAAAVGSSPPLSAAATPWEPPAGSDSPAVGTAVAKKGSPPLSPEAKPWYPEKGTGNPTREAAPAEAGEEAGTKAAATGKAAPKSWASVAAKAASKPTAKAKAP